MKKQLLTGLALAAALSTTAFAQTVPPSKTSVAEGEQATMTYFVQDSVGDVQLGRLGLEKAGDAGVRALAQAMVRDHTRTAMAGLQVARQIADDDARFKAGDDNQIQLSRLARFGGARFDREYVDALVDAHKTDIQTARDALAFVKTPAVRDYLRTSILVDTRHLRMAQALQSRLSSAG